MLNAIRRSLDRSPANGHATSAEVEGVLFRAQEQGAKQAAGLVSEATLLMSTTADNSQVRNVQDIGKFRGIVHLVSESATEAIRKECIVLDVGFSTIHIVCVPEFLARSTYDAYREAARREGLSIEKTITATDTVIAQLYARAESLQRPGIAMGESTRHIQLYDDLVRGAFELKASDIHITLGNNTTKSRVRVRRHGRMRDWKVFDTPVLLSALSAGFQSKTRAGTNSGGSFNIDRAMSTMTLHLIGDAHVHCRLSSYPLNNGGCAIDIRLLQSGAKQESFPTLEKLGYSLQHVAQITRALATTKGLILLNGSTGSGKSTSLRSFIYAIPRWTELCIRSVEEPVEYELPGVDQMSVQTSPDDEPEEVQKKFNAALKQLVRMDPDVGMMGEIRDPLSAHMAIQLVQTGHKGMATLHGDSAEDALFRLVGKQFDVDSSALATACTLSGYQKLLPVLCEHCRL
ncbi:MAG: ATPase, T2SS/T4P/T4SS family, partial [Cupriavidus necator]